MSTSPYHTSRLIHVGGVPIGGGSPVVVQSMAKTRTEDVRATVAQIRRLEKIGCELVRVAVPHRKALDAIPTIKAGIHIPLIADIHFSSEFAIGALELGADAVRVNPGNLGGLNKFREVAKFAAACGKAVRIGVNAGSLEPGIAKKKNLTDPQKLVQSAMNFVETAEHCGLRNFKVSLKSSDVRTTVEACREFARACDVPQHIGITEAGDEFSGTVRSAAGLGVLLYDGIGDTLRISLTAPPVREVQAAWELLRALGIRSRGVEVISCPTCGRCTADLQRMVKEVKKQTAGIAQPISVAVMGCEVNGPGEAAHADAGIAMNRKGSGTLFSHGKTIKKVTAKNAVSELLKEIEKNVQ